MYIVFMKGEGGKIVADDLHIQNTNERLFPNISVCGRIRKDLKCLIEILVQFIYIYTNLPVYSKPYSFFMIANKLRRYQNGLVE